MKNKINITIESDLESILIIRNNESDINKVLSEIRCEGTPESLSKNLTQELLKLSTPLTIEHDEMAHFYGICPIFCSLDEISIEISSQEFNVTLSGEEEFLDRSIFFNIGNITKNDESVVTVLSKIHDKNTVDFSFESEDFQLDKLKFVIFKEETSEFAVEDYRLIGFVYDDNPAINCWNSSNISFLPSIESIDLSDVSMYKRDSSFFSLSEAIDAKSFGVNVSFLSDAVDM